MKLSVVTTLYKSSPYITEFYERIIGSVKSITDDYEIIFVNDGSPDDSKEVVLSLMNHEKNIRLIDLSRNFGHHKAIMAGLNYSSGEQVFLIDCDLEENPELIEQFYKEFENSKLTMEARLMHRKFDQKYLEFAYRANPEGFKQFKEIPKLPITEIVI